MFDADGNLDPLKTVLYLRRSSQQAATISNLRPRWNTLGPRLATLRTAGNAAILDGDDDEPLAPRKLLDPAEGSRAQLDEAATATRTLNKGNALVVELLSEYVVATSDHLWAMSTLCAADPPFRPLLATGRILLDAGAHVSHLLDPTIDPIQRAARAANIELDAIREQLNDLSPQEADEADELTTQRHALLQAGDSDGVPRFHSRRGDPQPWFSPGRVSTGQMADFVLGEGFGESIWRSASSVVHARDRPLLEFVGGRGDVDLSGNGLGWTMGVPYVASCLVVMTETYMQVAAYLGRESLGLAKAVTGVRRVLQEMSGDHDEELLDRAGIDRSGWV